MKTIATPLVAGLVFGFGLTVSQMINPQKVLGFLDLAGDWDPSLAFVMVGAIAVTAIGYKFVLKAPKPLIADRFRLPTKKDIDIRLIVGAALFGIGWGIVGLCPGPALAGLTLGGWSTMTFVAAMVAGIGLFRVVDGMRK